MPDYQLSLAIGKEGQNARLAARLTGFKIDIKSETQAIESGELPENYMELDEGVYEEEVYEEGYDEDYDDSYGENYEDDYGYEEEGYGEESYDEGSYDEEPYGDDPDEIEFHETGRIGDHLNSNKKIPMRKCVGCQEMKSKKEMLRVLRTQEGEFRFGRHREKERKRRLSVPLHPTVWQKAVKQKGLERSFKTGDPTETSMRCWKGR